MTDTSTPFYWLSSVEEPMSPEFLEDAEWFESLKHGDCYDIHRLFYFQKNGFPKLLAEYKRLAKIEADGKLSEDA